MSGLHCRKTHQFCFILFYSVLSCLSNILFGYMPCFVLCSSDMFHSNSVLLSSDLSNSILFSSDLSFLLCSVPFSCHILFCCQIFIMFFVLFMSCSDILFNFILFSYDLSCSILFWTDLLYSFLFHSFLLYY